MAEKQVAIILETEFLGEISRLCEIEQRSLTRQLRKFVKDLPSAENPVAYNHFRSEFSIPRYGELENPPGKRVLVKFPEDEMWDLKLKATRVRLTPGEFLLLILKLWVEGKFQGWLEAHEWEKKNTESLQGNQLRQTA